MLDILSLALGVLWLDTSEPVVPTRGVRDVIIDGLKSADAGLRSRSVRVVGDLGGPEAVSLALIGLRDADPTVRYTAAESLGRLGPAARSAVPALINALPDTSRLPARGDRGDVIVPVGDAAAAAIRSIGVSEEQLPPLLRALHHAHPAVRTRAAVALQGMRHQPTSALAALMAALQGEVDLDATVEILHALGSAGKAASSAVSAISELVVHDDPDVRAAAQDALAKISSAR